MSKRIITTVVGLSPFSLHKTSLIMKIIFLFAWMAVAAAQIAYYPEPAYKSSEYPPQPYSFAWEVNDPTSDNNYGHSETSDGNVVSGSYRVALPDGRTQIVNYTADKNGYVADVEYEDQADYKPAASYSAPASQAPPPAYPATVTTSAPVYRASEYNTPAPPAYQAPADPAYKAPAPPADETPAYPVYKTPAAPKYKASSAPVYTAPGPAEYEAPGPQSYKPAATSGYKGAVAPAYDIPATPTYETAAPPAYKIPAVPIYRTDAVPTTSRSTTWT